MGTFLAASTATQCASRNTWDQGAVAFTDHNRDLQINGQNTAISLLPQDYADIDVPCCAFRNRSYLRFKKKSQPTGNKGVLFFPQTGEIQKLREKSQLIQLRNLPVIRLQYGRHS